MVSVRHAPRSALWISPSVSERKRVYILFLLLTSVFAALVLRLLWLQIVRGPELHARALEQRMRPVPVDPRRGTIYDRNMRELAVSISADSVYAIPAEVRDPASAARMLAPLLEMGEDTLLARLTARQQTVWLKRKVGHDVAARIKELAAPGIGVAESGQRFYPRDTLAAQVIGIAGIDNQGLEGLEQLYDSELRGVRGQIVAERDATGKEIPEGEHSYAPARDGKSIVLTIDEVIQYICERELERAMADTRSEKGIILAMDPMTGEVLAVALRPTFNPNDYSRYPSSLRRNTAVCDMFEPGSTFKVVTAAAALEEGVVTPNTGFYDPGYIKVEDRTIRCWKAGGHGSQTFTEAVENSCNPVFATLAVRLGSETFARYVRAFGLTDKTGIDFPGEAVGMMHRASKMGPVELATSGFGQGISVTPLQLLNALCAVANGGTLMQPMLVREVIDESGASVRKIAPTRIRQVISERSARQLSTILQSVVVNGSGARAAVPGYAVAGKTGTAQKPERGGYGDKRIASFMGYAPANDPRIAVLVVLDEPKTDVKYGGVLAAPAFAAVIADAMRYMEIPPTYSATVPSQQSTSSFVTVPDLLGLALPESMSSLKAVGLVGRAEGAGAVVTNQVPKAGSRVAGGTTVVVYFGPEQLYNLEGDFVEVPDVTGKTLKEAAILLGARGLTVQPMGRGIVARQQPLGGASVRRGSAVTIFLEE